jgi:flagellar basal body-associated protein FliL
VHGGRSAGAQGNGRRRCFIIIVIIIIIIIIIIILVNMSISSFIVISRSFCIANMLDFI